MNNHNHTNLRHHFSQMLLLLLLLFVALPTMAQEKLTVDTMYLDTGNANAQLAEVRKYKEKDSRGMEPGLVIVQLAAEKVEFDCDNLNEPQDYQRNASEYWLVICNGSRELKIIVEGFTPLEVDFRDYDFKKIESGKTYILKVNVPQKRVNYDKQKPLFIKISPPNATLLLGTGSTSIDLSREGEAEINIPIGSHQFKVTAQGYHPKDSDIVIKDDNKKDSLIVKLKPKEGNLIVYTNPLSASVSVDDKVINRSGSEPITLRIGNHTVIAKAEGYKPDTIPVIISEGPNDPIRFNLKQLNTFEFTSSPSGAEIIVDGTSIGTTPLKKDYTTGDYQVRATKVGYLDEGAKPIHFDSSNPKVHINLKKIYNYENEFYAEANVSAGTFVSYGATVGGYFKNINAEVSYLIGSGKSETIYWSGDNTTPIACEYTPSTNFALKVGYGIPISNRYRLTPQAGIHFLKLKESVEDGGNTSPAGGANTTMGVAGVRFSVAIANNIGISISPEYDFSMSKSKGFELLSEVSSKIKKWGNGFNVKLGITALF